jgi:hypothetical protein
MLSAAAAGTASAAVMTGYCAAHDPIAQAVAPCDVCGELAYPADAAWVSRDLVLVQFRPGCEHLEEHVQLVDVTRLVRRCAATARTGAQCRNRPKHGSAFCGVHDPAARARKAS